MCVKLPPEDLNSDPCLPTPQKHLYLWSEHHAKGARCWILFFDIDIHDLFPIWEFDQILTFKGSFGIRLFGWNWKLFTESTVDKGKS